LAVVYRSTARRYARSRDVEREYVCDVRRLRASRLNDDEIGRDDADRNGPSRLKRHGRGIRNSVTSDLRRTHAIGKRKKWAIFLPALPEPGEGELCTCTLGTRRRGRRVAGLGGSEGVTWSKMADRLAHVHTLHQIIVWSGFVGWRPRPNLSAR